MIAVFIAMVLYTSNRFFLKHLDIPFIGYILKNHFNDFIGGFVFSAYTDLVLVFFGRTPIRSLWLLMLFMFGVSFLWEFLLPLFSHYSTSDIWDMAAYLLGAVLYYFVMKKDNDIIR